MIELNNPADYEFQYNILSIGGGHGQERGVSGISKRTNPANIIVAVPGSDEGGSSGKGQKDLKKVNVEVSPAGDVRQAARALMREPQRTEQDPYYDFRFPKHTDLETHNVVNLEIMALQIIYGSQEEAIRAFMYKNGIPGRIIPATPRPSRLQAILKNGAMLVGEDVIDTRYDDKLRGKLHWTNPIDFIEFQKPTVTTLSLIEAARAVDLVINMPGDLYTSLLANYCGHGLAPELARSQARKIICMNAFTKPGETDFGRNGFYAASDCLRTMGEYMELDSIDAVIFNKADFPEDIVTRYAKANQRIIPNDLDSCQLLVPNAKLIEEPVAFYDKRARSVKHNPDALADQILKYAASVLH